jgi:hypothetical protein
MGILMTEFPRNLLPEDSADVELVHYKAIAEWLYLNEASARDRVIMHDMIDEYRSLYADTHDLEDFEQNTVFWHGWEFACQSFGWFISQDCPDDPGHVMEHFTRAMRYSAILMLGMSNDLPTTEADEE